MTELLKKEAKIINWLGRSDECPRLNPHCKVFRRNRRNHFRPKCAGHAVVTRISRFATPRDFFQEQLRMINERGNKLTSVHNQIIATTATSSYVVSKNKINYQFGTSVLKRHRNKAPSIHNLPTELLAEILVRLPVKYILRCRCVQKSWNTFIQSPVFITLQLNKQKKIVTDNQICNYPKYLFSKLRNRFDPVVRYDDVQCEEYCKLEFLPGLPNHAWFAVSYGLICASSINLAGRDYNRNIYLWNPLVGKYKTLPDSPLPSPQNSRAWEALAFGFLPQVNDYVVVQIVKPFLPPNRHTVIIGVYSLNTNSWKKLSQDNVFSTLSSNDSVVFVNGAAFWVGLNSHMQGILICFDTKTDILCEISLPDWAVNLSLVPVIHPFGQSIAYFVWNNDIIHFDMWLLKYDHMNEFKWEKKMCVTPSKDVQEDVLGVRNNGDPILAKSNNLISYDVDSHQANGFVDSWDRWTPDSHFDKDKDYGRPYVIRPFVESLVMLNNDQNY